MAIYSWTVGSTLEWREVEGGGLPGSRVGLRATVVNNILYVTGGRGDRDKVDTTSILSWNPTNEFWQTVGTLFVTRYNHAAVAVSSSILESACLGDCKSLCAAKPAGYYAPECCATTGICL